MDTLHVAVQKEVSAQQIDAVLEIESTNGKLLAFIESHCQIRNRKFTPDRTIIHASMSKRVFADLSRNEQVKMKIVD